MSADNSRYTAYMQGIVSGVMDRMGSFYCREDFERKLREVMDQYTKKQSGYRFRLRELSEMCRSCGVDIAAMADSSRSQSELEKLPVRAELRRKLLRELHGIYLEFPDSGHYMERLVRRLLKGEFAEDSLRLAILKKFMRDTDYHTGSLAVIAEKRLCGSDAEEYSRLKGAEKKLYIAEHLDEGIFELLSSETDPMSWLAFLTKHIRAEESGSFAFSAQLRERLGGGDTAEDSLGILRARIEKNDAENSHALIEAVEKEFCAYLRRFTYTKKKAKDPTKATGTRDEIYRQAKKDFLKPMKKALTLLKLADDLACGKFRVNGTTKEQLYIFAAAFDMSAGAEGEEYRDIEKNLFHDYYNDDLLRHVLNEEYIRNISSYETEPSGEGINYKNYVEIIYLYYLTRFPDLPGGIKLEKIQSMIERCAKMAKESPKRVEHSPDERTEYFRGNYFERVLSISDEELLAEYISTHYYIYDPRYSSARISYASERNTASEHCACIARLMTEQFPEYFSADYGSTYLPGGIELEELMESAGGENSIVNDFRNDSAFIELLRRLDAKLRIKKRRVLALRDGRENNCTRTEMIALYYSYFRLVLEELAEDFAIMDLPGLYREFCEGDGIRPGINHYLRESRFQTISPKNAYDMFVIFALFLELTGLGE